MRDLIICMGGRASAHSQWPHGPREPWDRTIGANEEISALREKLIRGESPLLQPTRISVVGTLFPSALLSSGWWGRDEHEDQSYKMEQRRERMVVHYELLLGRHAKRI